MVGVFQRCISDGDKTNLATQCHTAILNNDSIQDSDPVLGIIKSSLKLYKRGHSDITEIFICSDNAG